MPWRVAENDTGNEGVEVGDSAAFTGSHHIVGTAYRHHGLGVATPEIAGGIAASSRYR
jgi:TPP-dependent pyruvate/acetoin dehydrogenase alpha subunit